MPTYQQTLLAPAKINLSLRVVGRRADGYHEIDSVFVPLTLADDVEVACEPAATTTVACACPGRPELDGAENLAARAAAAYLERVGVTVAVDIRIQKRIWAAAGLGGGSSDAAAVLRALHDHFGEEALGQQDLERLALRLGADVPFFLQPRVARARGVGERLSAFGGVPALHLVLANPREGLSTAEVYAGLGLMPGTHRADPMPHPERLDGSLASVVELVRNDLETAAIARCSPIAELKQALLARGALAASMSGSGATVFGIFAEPGAADRAAEEIATIPNVYTVRAGGACSLTDLGRSPIPARGVPRSA